MNLWPALRGCAWVGVTGIVAVAVGLVFDMSQAVDIGAVVFAAGLAAWALLKALVLSRPLYASKEDQRERGRVRRMLRIAGTVFLAVIVFVAIRLIFFVLE